MKKLNIEKRQIARVVAVAAVALAAGQLVQSLAHRPKTRAPAETTTAAAPVKPSSVQPVSSGPEPGKPAPAPAPVLASQPPVAPSPLPPKPATAEAPALAMLPEPPAPAPDPAPAPAALPQAEACPVTLELMAEPQAMIGLTLLAPCHPNERVVLQHAGLAVTGLTTATGALFTSLPALQPQAEVTTIFADGTRTSAALDIPEAATVRRFGIQWQAEDAFQLQAFEGGASWGEAGNVSARTPRASGLALPADQGFVTALGDASAPAPLLAEVYTFPADSRVAAEVVIEAAVTEATCGREIFGQTLTATGGKAATEDLTLAMPDCDGVGDYLVLNNLALPTNIAAAN